MGQIILQEGKIMKYKINQVNQRHLIDKAVIFVLAIGIGMVFGWAIVCNTQLNNCEQTTDQWGNKWVECT